MPLSLPHRCTRAITHTHTSARARAHASLSRVSEICCRAVDTSGLRVQVSSDDDDDGDPLAAVGGIESPRPSTANDPFASTNVEKVRCPVAVSSAPVRSTLHCPVFVPCMTQIYLYF